MNQRRGVLLAILGVGAVVAGVWAVAGFLRRPAAVLAAPTPRPPLTAPVVVVTHDVPVNTILRAADLTLVDMPIELVPASALTTFDATAGMITKVPLVTGEMVLQHHLFDPTNISGSYAFAIRTDQVLMAFPANDLMSQIKILQPGDQVDILVSVMETVRPGSGTVVRTASEGESNPTDELFTFNALQRSVISAVVVEVTDRPQGSSSSRSASSRSSGASAGATPVPTPTPFPESVEPQAILLALAPQDALVLKHLKDAGGVFDIVLRSPASTQHFELAPVSSEYVKDQYQLVITR